MQLWRKIFGAEIVSLFLLRMKLVDFSYNIMFTALFTCLSMCFYIFYYFNNLSNNKLLDQDPQWVHEASLEFPGSRWMRKYLKTNNTQIFVDEVETQLREKPLRGNQTQEFHYSEDKARYKTVTLTYTRCSGRILISDV
jgi:hypothetical protein